MKRRKLDERTMTKAAFLFPSIAVCALFLLLPGIMEFYLSLTDWNGISEEISFVGLRNFRELARDGTFLLVLKNTLVFCVLTVALEHVLSLSLAVLVNRGLRGARFHKAAVFLPCILSTIVVALAFSFLMNPLSGALGRCFGALGLERLADVNWLGDSKYALLSVILVSTWQYTGYCMVIYLGGLKGIPVSILEAGEVDGTNAWQRFWRIEFPSIAPSFTVNTVLSVIGALKAFELVYSMTGGGPGNATEVISTYIYKVGFASSRMGYGTAVSLFLFVLVSVISFLQIKLLKARENSL